MVGERIQWYNKYKNFKRKFLILEGGGDENRISARKFY